MTAEPITADDLELAIIGDLMRFEFPDFLEDIREQLVEQGVTLKENPEPLPELDIDNDLVHAIAKYLIDTEELWDQPLEDLLRLSRFIYGFVQEQT